MDWSAMRVGQPICVAALVAMCSGGCRAGGEDPAGASFPLEPHRTGVVEAVFGEVDGELVFGSISQLDLGPDGDLYVVERERRDIRVLSPEGEVLRTIGGEGQGPGEFERTPWIVGWRGDTLVAADPHRRMHWFDPDGRVVRTESGPQPAAAGQVPFPLVSQGIFADGSYHAFSSSLGGGDQRSYWISEDGIILDTMFAIDRTSPEVMAEVSFRGCSWSSLQPAHHRATSGWSRVALQHRRLALVLADWRRDPDPVIVVMRRALEGDTLYRVEVPYAPVPLDEEAFERQLEQRAESFRRRCPETPPLLAQQLIRREIRAPDEDFPVLDLQSTADGHAWLRVLPQALGREGASSTAKSEERPLWLVVAPGGNVEGTIDLPPRFNPRAVDGRSVWGVLRDELGVQYVARVSLEDG